MVRKQTVTIKANAFLRGGMCEYYDTENPNFNSKCSPFSTLHWYI